MAEDRFRHARSHVVHPTPTRPKPLTDKEKTERENNLILLIATMKQEALVLGLMYTFHGMDRAEKAVGWEVAAHRSERYPSKLMGGKRERNAYLKQASRAVYGPRDGG